MNFYETIKMRRSIYNIGNKQVVPKSKIEEIIKMSLKHVPSAFNEQSSRVVVLFEKNHEALWDTIMECLRKIVPEDGIDKTKKRIESFRAGYGTILFYEDTESINNMEKKYELYKENFQSWSLQSIGMLQYTIWNMLELEELGASLQHYNVFIEKYIQQKYEITDKWKLISQMPFGNIVKQEDEKIFNYSNEYFKSF